MPAATTRQKVGDFFERHGIQTITLTPMAGVTDAHRVCDLALEFSGDDNHAPYRAQFKLQSDEALIGDTLRRIDATGQLQLVEGESTTPAINADIDSFFRAIATRVAKVRHEQSVQSVKFLGNSFILNAKTVFTVVEDNEGRLSIELHKGKERQPAMLMASSLLDGLYDGSIALLDGNHN